LSERAFATRVADGTLCVGAVSEVAAHAAWALVRARLDPVTADARHAFGERVELDLGAEGTVVAWLKADRLRGGARLRHGLRARLGLRAVPRLSEHRNLAWLREHGLGAPRPLASGTLIVRGLPTVQWLATELVPDARTLRAFLEAEAAPSARAPVLDELARDTGRMHALGFVHRDLYPRNVLVRGPHEGARVVFLDAWAGGPGPGLRGPAYDLGALMLSGAALLTDDEQRAFLARYLSERAARGRPVADVPRVLAHVARERRRLAERLACRPHERRGRPPPPLDWRPPPSVLAEP
jgi:tRNA A-37 threonylcarbamoyl transferase component Bud32